MKIKRLEITGFKSFIERTVLDFDEGISSIVGPNGCGKSNIVDAIRWVMGEQSARHLRGRTMEDVIFGGSENRKPLGMAEVSLVMDNSDGNCPTVYRDYAEIQVCRRLYRSGESEYLLNKTPCRLLDITELFMDTGVGNRAYSIIEQGKIGMIVNAKPEERRTLIEEAAGVTKFKARKKSALRKIEATRQNLLRLTDIISEVRRQMNSLKRQAQRAQRFREFREELKGIELQFGLREYQLLQDQASQAGRAVDDHSARLETESRQVEQAELALEEARLRHAEQEKQVAKAQEQVYALTGELQKIENRLEFADREIINLDRQQERCDNELDEIDRRLQGADQEERQLDQLQTEQQAAARREQEELDTAESRLHELNLRETELAAELEKARGQLYDILSELSRMNSQQEDAGRRMVALDDQVARNHQEAVAVKEQLERLSGHNRKLAGQISAIETQRSSLVDKKADLGERQQSLRGQMERLEADLLVQREELSRASSRLMSLQQLEKNLEGYSRGVKTLLADAAIRQSLRGLVADILEVPPTCEAALEAVLEDRVQALVPNSVANVPAALETLRAAEGRCTFLLPDYQGASAPGFPDGTPLVELVSCAADERRLVERLLAGVFLVDRLEPFMDRNLPFGVTLVTAQGQVFNYRGELTGGGRQILDQGLLHQKREIKELDERVRVLENEVAALNRRRSELLEEITATEEALRTTEHDIHQQEIRAVDSQKDLKGLEQDQERLQSRLEVLSFEEEQLHEEQETLKGALEQATAGRTAGEEQKTIHEERVAELQKASSELREQVDQVRQQVTNRKVTLAGLTEREEGTRNALQRLHALREELAGRQVALRRERIEAVERQSALKTECGELKVRMEELYKRRLEEQHGLDSQRDDFETSRDKIEGREAELKTLRARVGEARDHLSARQVQSRELHLQMEHLRQSFLEKFRTDLADAATAAGFDPDFDETSGRQRRDYLLRRIEEIGDVNLMAIEEFQELEERYGFLVGQQEDLQQSLDGLQAAIAKINRTTRQRFRDAFDQVNDQFRVVFPRLFNGGQAELRLTDESDLLETGIDIVAQPPGKKLQNVTLLSGGEKALTAVALIFSIFLIKPSPFCLLDEVDAPLDDANIGRFNEMVKSMSADSQFIIITHNKRTMEIADNLYGITMEEPGVSKLVSVRMREVA